MLDDRETTEFFTAVARRIVYELGARIRLEAG
ncbi:hypothetical protein BKA22_000947 [Cellulomonas soli]|nr:hypothetical protein [Cellulomonas soli]